MRSVFAVVAVTALVLSSSFALARAKRKAKPYDQLAHVPEAARARANPLGNDPGAAAAGKKLYERHCADCHGATGESGRKGPGLRAPEV